MRFELCIVCTFSATSGDSERASPVSEWPVS